MASCQRGDVPACPDATISEKLGKSPSSILISTVPTGDNEVFTNGDAFTVSVTNSLPKVD